jgi:predicted nucleic acid-binding protein
MKKIPFPRGLSQEDRSVIYLAQKLEGAIVISSDKLVRDFAGKLHLPYHGIFWILDQLVSQGLIEKSKAFEILSEMPKINSMYQAILMKQEIDKRAKIWS